MPAGEHHERLVRHTNTEFVLHGHLALYLHLVFPAQSVTQFHGAARRSAKVFSNSAAH